MKGLMATLLAISMTGMVLAQQPSNTDADTPFLLLLDDERIESLLNNPQGEQTYLTPDVKGKVFEIVLRHKKYNSEENFRQGLWQPSPPGEQLIPFVITVTPAQLRHLIIDPNGLQTFMPKDGMPRVNQIVIRLDNSAPASVLADNSADNAPPSPNPGAGTGGNFGDNRLPPDTTGNRATWSNIDPSLAAGNSRPDIDRMTLPDSSNSGDRWRLPPDRNNGAGNEFGNNRNTFQPSTPMRTAADDEAARRQRELEFQMAQLHSTNLKNQTLAKTNELLEKQLREAQQELDRQRYFEELRKSNRETWSDADRYAMAENGQYRYGDNSPISHPSGTFPNRKFGDYGNYLMKDQSRMPPERQQVAMSPKPNANAGGISDLSMTIPGPQSGSNNQAQPTSGPTTPLANSKLTEKTNGFLWFMLFCSLGLNVYLALISRSFHTRYAELADELRETFTGTA